jgi:hypothetical protein
MPPVLVLKRLLRRWDGTLQKSLLDLFDKWRITLPVREVYNNGGATIKLLTTWRNEGISWYQSHLPIWAWLQRQAVKNTSWAKADTLGQVLYQDWIDSRSVVIGELLANVNAEVIGEVLRTWSEASWTKLQSELRASIGLQPRQYRAFVRQAEKLVKRYGEEKALKYIEKLYMRKLRYRANLIARTEMRMAITDAQMADIGEKLRYGLLPPDVEKRWSTRGDDKVCSKCQLNEAAGWIPYNASFPTGAGSPSDSHPGCHCGIQFRSRSSRFY